LFLFYLKQITGEAMIVRARSFGSKSQSAQAQGLKTPSCDILIQIGKVTY